MVFGQAARARKLLEAGAFAEAAAVFIETGEHASAARAFAAAKDFAKAAAWYEKARKPADAARCWFAIRDWRKAAELYAQAGDTLRAELALEQLKKEQGASAPPRTEPTGAGARVPVPAPGPPAEADSAWPEGELWQAIRAGDTAAAAELYLKGDSGRGWSLVGEATAPEALRGLAETLFQARDYAEAAEAFQKAGEVLRCAQCLSLAGLNEDAAHHFYNLGMRIEAAQHLEKAHAWDQAATIYLREERYLEAARCHEKDDEPVKAAAVYLKARQPDLALPLLQSVAPAHPSFIQCRLLAGKIFFQKRQTDLALSMLSPLLENLSPQEESLETFYQAAVLMEMGGAVEKARDAYRRLQETRFGYRDVTGRMEKLPAAGAPAAPPAPPPPVIAAPAVARPAPAAPRPPAEDAPPDLAPLRACSLFGQLGNEDLRRIWLAGKTGACRPGRVLLKAGEVAPGLMVVLSGGITITPDPGNPNLATGYLGPGDYLGLGSLLKGPPPENAMVAQKDTRLLVLSPAAVETLLSTDAEMGMRFYRSVAEHLVQTLIVEHGRSPGA
jgi:tetratricopeptide (TPR) repeat protein